MNQTNNGEWAVKGDMMNVIECTIKMRREAQTNYANLSLAVADKDLRRLFAMLAAAEDEHIDKLLDINEDFKRLAPAEKRLSGSACAYNPFINPRNPEKTLPCAECGPCVRTVHNDVR